MDLLLGIAPSVPPCYRVTHSRIQETGMPGSTKKRLCLKIAIPLSPFTVHIQETAYTARLPRKSAPLVSLRSPCMAFISLPSSLAFPSDATKARDIELLKASKCLCSSSHPRRSASRVDRPLDPRIILPWTATFRETAMYASINPGFNTKGKNTALFCFPGKRLF